MEINMDPLQKQMLDDVFDAFSMLAGGNYVSLMHVEGGFTRYSPGSVELFDLPGEYIPNGAFDWTEYVHPEDRKRYLDAMIPLIEGKTFTYDLNYRVRTKSGEYINTRQVGAVLRNAEGNPSLIGGMVINEGIMENTDPITVLRNKYGFYDDLGARMEKDGDVIVLLLGISKLGSINGIYGYSYGNRVLQEVAWLIQETVGQRGAVYRMDGASFAVMTSGHSPQEVAAIYDSLRLKLQRGIRVDGVRHNLTANGGLITTKDLEMDAGTVYACLRSAYRESRERRHGELVDFNGSANYDARASLEMVGAIRDSIIEGCRGFSIKYQPVCDAETGEPVGVETLLRWTGEPYGEVMPQDFLPILENDFVFEELGSWLLRRAMADGLRFLERRPGLLLGVNVSPSQLEDEYFMDNLFDIQRQTGFPLENLCLELTKGCRLLELSRLRDVIAELRSQGARILIDDFGTGVDSIGYLRGLVSDFVKLDPALLRGIEGNEVHRKTVGFLADLAAIHGTKVCVKGVTTAAARDILRQFPVYAMQGNYFAPPVPAETLLTEILLHTAERRELI